MPSPKRLKQGDVCRFGVSSFHWLEAAGDEDGPKLPRFKIRAYTGGLIRVMAFYRPVVIDLAGLRVDVEQLPILFDHDSRLIVGHSESHKISAKSVDLQGVISGGGETAREVAAAAKNGFPWKSSVGVLVEKVEYVEEGAVARANGKSFTGPITIVRGGVLYEASLLSIAADSNTDVSIAARAAEEQPMNEEFATWLEAKGFNPESITEAQQTSLKAMFDAEVKAKAKPDSEPASDPDPKPKTVEAGADPVADMRRQAAAEAKRIADVTAATEGFPEIRAKALSEGWDVRDAKLHVLEAKFAAPAIQVASGNQLAEPQVLEATLCMSAGLSKIEEHYSPETLEAAAKHRGFGLQDAIMMQARANGYCGPSVRIHRGNIKEVFHYAFVKAAFSTVGLDGILSNIANKFLLEGFMDVEQVWREFASISSARDFKTMTHYRMLDDMAFEEVGPTGELKHGELSEESYEQSVKTYGKMLTLTRVQILNDDLGAFDTIRERIGRGGGIKLNRVFWAAFLDNSAFFTSDRGNLITDVLGEDGIAAAELALASMTEGDNPIDVGGPQIMLVPPALDPTARKWYVSQEMRDTTASRKATTANIYLNKYRPVMSRYITTAYGGAATQWFIVPAGAGEMAPMDVAFLDGNQTPIVESADADFATLGVQFRGYWDFGTAKKEWRASVKSAGTG